MAHTTATDTARAALVNEPAPVRPMRSVALVMTYHGELTAEQLDAVDERWERVEPCGDSPLRRVVTIYRSGDERRDLRAAAREWAAEAEALGIDVDEVDEQRAVPESRYEREAARGDYLYDLAKDERAERGAR